MYNTEENVLVVRKSDCQSENIGDGYFIVPKKEWHMEDDGWGVFHLFLTKVDGDRVYLFLTNAGNPIVFRELPLSRKSDYIEI